MKSRFATCLTYVATIAAGCGAAVAIANTPLPARTKPATPVEVVRLDPVVVTVSKAAFDAMREDGRGARATRLARSSDARKVARG